MSVLGAIYFPVIKTYCVLDACVCSQSSFFGSVNKNPDSCNKIGPFITFLLWHFSLLFFLSMEFLVLFGLVGLG